MASLEKGLIIEAFQVVVSVTDQTLGSRGSRFQRLSLVLSQEIKGAGDSSCEDNVNMDLQAFIRTMLRSKTWGARIYTYTAGAIHDDQVCDEYWHFVNGI